MRVLIAEDETIIRLDLRQMLEWHGLTVCAEARDGVEAVELARTGQPDLAVLDLRMPKLDGIEAARRIYAEQPLPILMLTAFADRRNVERAIDAGIFGYLVKPFRESDIVPAIHAAAARHAELLEARRAVGQRPLGAVVINVPSARGHSWPVTIKQQRDGSLDVGGTDA